MGRYFRCRFAGSSGSGSLIRLQSRCQPGLQPSQGSVWGGIFTSKLTHMAVAEFSYLPNCCSAGLTSLLAVGQRLPSVLCHMGLSIGQHTTWPLASLGQAREIESVRAKQKSVFCNLILEVTSHNSYKLHSRDNLLGIGDRW